MAKSKGRFGSVTTGGGPSVKKPEVRLSLRRFTADMRSILEDSLLNELEVKASVSERIFRDLVYHWSRDVERIEKDQKKNGVDPSKYFGYFGFWIRKLKPVYGAYRIHPSEDELGNNPEVEDINEQ